MWDIVSIIWGHQDRGEKCGAVLHRSGHLLTLIICAAASVTEKKSRWRLQSGMQAMWPNLCALIFVNMGFNVFSKRSFYLFILAVYIHELEKPTQGPLVQFRIWIKSFLFTRHSFRHYLTKPGLFCKKSANSFSLYMCKNVPNNGTFADFIC